MSKKKTGDPKKEKVVKGEKKLRKRKKKIKLKLVKDNDTVESLEQDAEKVTKVKEFKQPEGERLPKEVTYDGFKQLIKSDLYEWKYLLSEISAQKFKIENVKEQLQMEVNKNPKIQELQSKLNQTNAHLQKSGSEYTKFMARISKEYNIDRNKIAIDDLNGVITGLEEREKV